MNTPPASDGQPAESHASSDNHDLLMRMFDMLHRTAKGDEHDEGEVGSWETEEEGASDASPTLLGRMFEPSNNPSSRRPPPTVDVAEEDAENASASDRAEVTPNMHVLARMFHAMDAASMHAQAVPDFFGGLWAERPSSDATTTPADVDHVHHTPPTSEPQSACPTMSILQTHEHMLSQLPLTSRMFDANATSDERDKITQYEFQAVIREIVSVRHSIRDHVIQLRQLRAIHRKYEDTLRDMLRTVQQDGVRSCDYPLLFYKSRRTKRRVNKQVHQSEPLQAFMHAHGIQMSDMARKDLITLIKKESYIRNTEETIRSVPIDGK